MCKQCTHLFIPFFFYTLLLMVLAPYIGIGVPPVIKGPGPIQPTEPAATRPVPSSATIAFGRFRLLLDIFGLFCLLKYSLSLSRAFLKAALPLIIQRYIDFYSVLDPTSQYGQFILFPQTTAVRPENATVDNDRHGAMSLGESTIDCGEELNDLGNISSGDTKRLDKSALDVTAVSLSSSFSSSIGADIDDASNILGRNVSLVLTPKVALPNTGKPYSPLTAEREARRKFVTEALEPYRRHVPDVGSPISADLIAKSDLSLNPNKGLLNTKWLENIREIKFKIPTPLHVEEREGSVTPKAQDLRRQNPLNTDPPSSSLPRDTRVVTSLDAQSLIPETNAIAYENGLNGPGLTRAISVKDQSFAMSRPSDLDAELSGSYDVSLPSLPSIPSSTSSHSDSSSNSLNRDTFRRAKSTPAMPTLPSFDVNHKPNATSTPIKVSQSQHNRTRSISIGSILLDHSCSQILDTEAPMSRSTYKSF